MTFSAQSYAKAYALNPIFTPQSYKAQRTLSTHKPKY